MSDQKEEHLELAAQLAVLREVLGVVRGCYAALPGVDPGILAYADEAILRTATSAPAVDAYKERAQAEREKIERTDMVPGSDKPETLQAFTERTAAKLLIQQPQALRDYLVQKGMEAYKTSIDQKHLTWWFFEAQVRERMNNAAQTIANEVGVLDQERDAAIARAEHAEGQLACDACDGSGVAISGPCGCGGRGLPEMLRSVRVALHDVTRERDEARATMLAMREQRERYADRAERAEGERDELAAQLAALREAWDNVLRHEIKSPYGGGAYEQRSIWHLRDTFAGLPSAAVEAYARSVRAEALENAAEAYECDEDHDATGAQCPKAWLRARAACARSEARSTTRTAF